MILLCIVLYLYTAGVPSSSIEIVVAFKLEFIYTGLALLFLSFK